MLLQAERVDVATIALWLGHQRRQRPPTSTTPHQQQAQNRSLWTHAARSERQPSQYQPPDTGLASSIADDYANQPDHPRPAPTQAKTTIARGEVRVRPETPPRSGKQQTPASSGFCVAWKAEAPQSSPARWAATSRAEVALSSRSSISGCQHCLVRTHQHHHQQSHLEPSGHH